MKYLSKILILCRCLIIVYLNFLFECCNKIHVWLHEDTSQIVIISSKLGVSWLVCFIVTLLLMLSSLCHDLTVKFQLFMELEILVILGSLFFILVIIFNSVVPMIGGTYRLYPSNWWDYLILMVSATIFVGSVRKKLSLKSADSKC